MAKTSNNTEVPARKRTRTQTKAASSSNPPPSNPPPPNPSPQNQPQPFRRFTSNAAEERFHKIKEFEFKAERGFDLARLTGHPTFEKTLIEKGWMNLNAMVTKFSNKSISLEFFANAVSEREGSYVTHVRGKYIDFSATKINRVLGLPVPESCDVERKRTPGNWPKSQEEWDGLIVGLMKEGKGWVRPNPTSNPQRIDTADLLPEYRAWASFILSTIASTSSAAEMITARAFILLVLLSEHEQMDVGRIIAHNLHDMITKDIALGHSCLINFLCENAGVLAEPSDLSLRSQLPVTDSSMGRLEKKLEGDGAGGQHVPVAPAPHQAQPEGAYPPMHPALAEYIFSSAHWMEEASSQLYIEPPRFSQQFAQMSLQYQRPPSDSYLRFGSRESMRGYFQTNRDRAARREQEIELDYNHGESLATTADFVAGADFEGGDFGEASHRDQTQQHDE
jgi:hypothetical protein